MTATRAALLALADRCEQESGPDRELDAEIAVAAGWQLAYGRAWSPAILAAARKSRRGKWYHGETVPVPTFTASLDAALTLYDEVPTLIHSNPRWVARDALIQRADRLAAEAPQ